MNEAKPYLVMTNEELKKKKFQNRFFSYFMYGFFIIIGFIVFYMYRLDKYEFYLKNNEVLINNGSSYQVELTPKNSKYFDFLNYKYVIENPNIASVDKYGRIEAKQVGSTNLKVRYKNSFTSKIMKINIENIDVQTIDFKEEVIINTNESTKINPIINNEEKINTNVTYESNDSNVASVDEYGNVNPVGVGETTIIAKSENGTEGEVKVKIEPSIKEVQNISLSESTISLKKGKQLKLIASIIPIDATNQTLTWESDNDNVTVDNNGTISANKVGISTITVKANNGKSSSCKVIVEETTIEISSISLNSNSKELTVGESFQLTTTINPNNATIRNISWESSNKNIVNVVNGKITAIKEGSATITAKSLNGKKATCLVKVKSNEVMANSINLNITNTSLNVGGSLHLNAIITPNNTTNQNITWSSNNKNIATVNNGLVNALKEGTVIITAKTSNGKTATCTILIRKNVIVYKAVFYPNGANMNPVTLSCESRSNGCNITAPSIERAGFVIDGWNTDANANNANYPINSNITIAGDTNFYAITHKDITAKFKENNATLSFSSQTCSIYNANLSCNINTPTIKRTNYSSLGFNVDSNAREGSVGANQTISIQDNVTYYAITKIKKDGILEGCTGYMAVNEKLYSSASKSSSSKSISAGTPFTIISETGAFWYINTGSSKGYILHDYAMINLSDYIPSIIYNIANASSSIYASSGYNLPDVTGKKLYKAGKVYNNRLKKEEYIAPAMYSFAKKILSAQKKALKDGYTLMIYDSYRPKSVSEKIYKSLSELYSKEKTVRDNINRDENGKSWGQSWFLAKSLSTHNTAAAIDVTLAHNETKKEVNMPTKMHELSTKAVKTISSVKNNTYAQKLESYMTSSGLNTLASEWWHFQENASYNRIMSRSSRGCDFQPTKVLSY